MEEPFKYCVWRGAGTRAFYPRLEQLSSESQLSRLSLKEEFLVYASCYFLFNCPFGATHWPLMSTVHYMFLQGYGKRCFVRDEYNTVWRPVLNVCCAQATIKNLSYTLNASLLWPAKLEAHSSHVDCLKTLPIARHNLQDTVPLSNENRKQRMATSRSRA